MFSIARDTETKGNRLSVMLSVSAPSATDALTMWALVNRQEAEDIVDAELSALSEQEIDE